MPQNTSNISQQKLSKGEVHTFTIDALAAGGKAIARHNGMAIFLNRGIPGQTVTARITKSKKRFAEATVKEIIRQAEDEITPFCSHFGQCGGCLWQHMTYQQQLFWKRQFVEDSLRRIGGVEDISVPPVLASPRTTFFRNKMEFAFAPHPDAGTRSVLLGMRKQGAHQVVDITECHLQSPRCNTIVNTVRKLAASANLPAYEEKTQQGYLRFLIVREPEHIAATEDRQNTERQCLVQFITAPDTSRGERHTKELITLCKSLKEAVPSISTLVISKRSHKAQIAYGEQTVHITSDDTKSRLTEELAGVQLGIDHDSFLQVNTSAATILYNEALRLADLKGTETVWDGYCGVGSITLLLARHAAHVTGFELGEAAISCAKQNAKALGIQNVEFYAGDIRKQVADRTDTPDVIVVDPPRAGMHEDVTETLLSKAPERIVYVSCDAATQARDIGRMLRAYKVEAVQPVDLFPHTPHIENIVLLVKR